MLESINFVKHSGQKLLELGGGANRYPQADVNVDVRQCFDPQGNPTVDFSVDFNEPLPICSEEWDGVLCRYALEHISWRKVRGFVSEVFRILKPGGKVCIITANTEAQIEWIKNNSDGWDGKDSFDSFSCVIFGDNDYPENSHKCFFNPTLLYKLFSEAGFQDVVIQSYGARDTDLALVAVRPKVSPDIVVGDNGIRSDQIAPLLSREETFDKHYFNGGGKVGGYAREGYRDFPVHEITFQHILTRRPKSVLEIGCARGYILKRLQDQGIRANGLEISRHCWLTRVCEGIINKDICETPWPYKEGEFDLCFSIATLEHIPEEFLPKVLAEMARVSSSGLHGIDFGNNDDGFDRTHITLRPRSWWEGQFFKYRTLTDYNIGGKSSCVEILDKEELERGNFPETVARGDGKVKLNVGCGLNMFHHGWVNIDVHDWPQFAQANGYGYLRHDVKQGLPYETEKVDLIFIPNLLEKLTYREGLAFLRECRRVLKPDGAMRIVVTDTDFLVGEGIEQFDELSEAITSAPTQITKLWALLYEGKNSSYDYLTLDYQLKEAGFLSRIASFRNSEENSHHAGIVQILKETQESYLGGINLFCNVLPKTANLIANRIEDISSVR